MTISDRTERILLDYVRESKEEQKQTRASLTDVSNRLADATGHLLVLDQRMTTAEKQIGRLDKNAEDTGSHNIAKLEKELEVHKAELAKTVQAKRKATFDWLVRFSVGLLLLGLGAAATLLLKGCAW